mmetsp:Transcript_37391/g.105527  ORF Transcript_37391/g.105527 Transcript_37391/m.105527 type:complete len:220 (-) Transcript_37391:139-798(-)|eukprot:CAMPEP_0117663920 /NCGR_PEP_ID=MMETSP0804-20121206/8892_1 /TAXON_ID=1074897 /ORGANISM="Tetraselmis astigmatica, Strain CCMP880" /LENGTH=219 /DNA_ID=CAMNT_0005471015 /DNA_START=75 /DNA_END=734 /DNA_ORIENTATION=+
MAPALLAARASAGPLRAAGSRFAAGRSLGLRGAAPRPLAVRCSAPLVLNKTKVPKKTAAPKQGEKREVPEAAPNAPKYKKVSSGRKCQLTGQKANNKMVVTFSHKRNKKLQHVNLQKKKVYWAEGERMVVLKISARTIKTIEKKGLQAMADAAGINLWKLPYTDVSESRQAYLAANPMKVPVKQNPRAMKNPEKLAASRKKPMQARYVDGRVMWYRPAE